MSSTRGSAAANAASVSSQTMAAAPWNSASSRFRRATSSASLGFQDGFLRAQPAVAEAQQHVALGHAVAVAHPDLAHRAALDVLDHLAVALDLDPAAGDDRAGDRGEHAPAHEADDEHHDAAEPEHQRPPGREVLAGRARRHGALSPINWLIVAAICSSRPCAGAGRESRLFLTRDRQALHRRLAAAIGRHRAPALHQIDPVALREGTLAMGHDDRRPAPLLVSLDRAGERHGADRIQVGVGLVQHHHHGRAVEGAGQRDALALPAGERGAARRDPKVVAAREPQDHLVRAGALGGVDHVLVPGGGREAGDVLRHGAVEQHHLLRQVADVSAQRLAVLFERRAVEPHGTAGRMPDAGQRTGERGLAGRRRPRDPHRLTRLQPERCAPNRRHLRARRRHRESLRLQDCAGLRQRGPCLLRRRLLQKRRQGATRCQHALQLRPLRPPPGRSVPARGPAGSRLRSSAPKLTWPWIASQAPSPQHHRLQEEPQRLRGHVKDSAPVGRLRANGRATRL